MQCVVGSNPTGAAIFHWERDFQGLLYCLTLMYVGLTANMYLQVRNIYISQALEDFQEQGEGGEGE